MNEQTLKLLEDPEGFVRRIVAEAIAERDMSRVATADDDRLLKVKDVARIKGVSTRTVYDWVGKKLIRHEHTPGGQLRFRRADVDKFQIEGLDSAESRLAGFARKVGTDALQA
jgi:excisionase family DNA binding protein